MSALNLTYAQIAEAVGVSAQTVAAFAAERRSINGGTLGEIEKYLKGRGIVFLDSGATSLNGGVGIRLRD